MKNRLISMLCVAALLLGQLPATAWAAEQTPAEIPVILTYTNTNYTGEGTEASPYTMAYTGAVPAYAYELEGVTLVAKDGEGTDLTAQIKADGPEPCYTYFWKQNADTALENAPRDVGNYHVTIAPLNPKYQGSVKVYFTITQAAPVVVPDYGEKTVYTEGDRLEAIGLTPDSTPGTIGWVNGKGQPVTKAVSPLYYQYTPEDTQNYSTPEKQEAGVTVHAVVLDHLEITKVGQIDYVLGTHFNPANFELTAVYSNGTQETIRDYTVTGGQSMTAATKYVTFTYGGKSVVQPIFVTESAPVLRVFWSVNGTVMAQAGTLNQQPTYSGNTDKPASGSTTYTFLGWTTPAAPKTIYYTIKDASAEKTATALGYTYAPLPVFTQSVTYTAIYHSVTDPGTTSEQVTVTFKNGSASLQAEPIAKGSAAVYQGATPVKTSTADDGYTYTYAFSGWVTESGGTTLAELEQVQSDCTVYAAFTTTKTPKEHTVIFKDGDNELKRVKVPTGGTAVYPLDMPTKEATAEFTYTFDKWVSEKNGTEPATLTNVERFFSVWASFTEEKRTYPVTWTVDGAVTATSNVAYGALPVYPKGNPAKPGYSFSKWQDESGNTLTSGTQMKGAIRYHAVFDVVVTNYNVTWQLSGATVETDNNVTPGTQPHYDGKAPTKEGETFMGWSDGTRIYAPADLPPVSAHVTYTGTFTKKPVFTIAFQDADGTKLSQIQVEQGGTPVPPETPAKAPTVQEEYSFSAWKNGEKDIGPATENATYTATYTKVARKYTVTWVANGEDYASTRVAYGQSPKVPERTPTKPQDEARKYNFSGWQCVGMEAQIGGKLPPVRSDVTYLALFISEQRKYDLTITCSGTAVSLNGILHYTLDGKDATATLTVGTARLSIPYGSTYEVTSPTVAGYIPADAHLSGRMGSGDRALTISYAPKDCSVTVQFMYHEENKATALQGQVARPISLAAKCGQPLTIPVPTLTGCTPYYEGAEQAESLSYTPSAEAEQTITIAYRANRYTITFAPTEWGFQPQTYEYGQAISHLPVYAPTDGKYFNGWLGAPQTMPAKDIVLTGDTSRGVNRFVCRSSGPEGQSQTIYTYYQDTTDADTSLENSLIAAYKANHPGETLGSFQNPVPVLKNRSAAGGTFYREANIIPQQASLTIHYTGVVGRDIPDYQKSLDVGRPYDIASPVVEGHTPSLQAVSGVLAKNTVLTVTYTKNSYRHSVRYVYANGDTAAQTVVAQVPYGEAYSVVPPTISGYTTTRTAVTGKMPAHDVTETVLYSAGTKFLTIFYQRADGAVAASPVKLGLSTGDPYEVASPEDKGYTPEQKTVSGRMGDADREITVIYRPNLYRITIVYTYSDGAQKTAETVLEGRYKEPYSVPSPAALSGYQVSPDVVAGQFGVTQVGTNVTIPVAYTKPGSGGGGGGGSGGGGAGGGGGGGGGAIPPAGVGDKQGDLKAAVTLGDQVAVLTLSDQDLQESIAAVPGGVFTVDLTAYPDLAAIALPLSVVQAVQASKRIPILELRTQRFSLRLDGAGLKAVAAAGTGTEQLVVLVKAVEAEALTAQQRQRLHRSDAALYALALVVEQYDQKGNKIGETPVAGWNGSLTLTHVLRAGEPPEQLMLSGLRNDKITYYTAKKLGDKITFQADGTGIYAVDFCPVAAFADCRVSDWYHGDVEKILALGLMKGTDRNHFAPGGMTDRATVVTVLHRLAGTPPAPSAGFTDLTQDWYRAGVDWAAQAGITKGVTATAFVPDGPVTREQLVTFLYRFALSQGKPVAERADLSVFSDVGALSAFAQDAMAWAVARGIITGRSATELAPRGDSSRAELAAVLARFLSQANAQAPKG